MRERPISSVPKPAILLLAVAFCMQIFWHFSQPATQATTERLGAPPATATLRIASIGEPIALAKILMLYVQAFDQQSGLQLSFRQLDYIKLRAWLTAILALDPAAQYPLFAASLGYMAR